MVNCGIGACAADDVACGVEITQMILDIIIGVAQCIVFVLSLGIITTSVGGEDAAKAPMNKVYTNLSSAMSSTLTMMKKIATSSTLRSAFIKTVKTKAAKILSDFGILTDLSAVCSTLASGILVIVYLI